LKNEPVTKLELDLAKSFIAGGFARSLESPQTVANFALNINMYGLPANYYETYLQKLAAVSIEDVTRMAKKYITPSKARIVVVGNKDEVMDKLTVFDKDDGKVELYDIYANPRKIETATLSDITGSALIEKYLTALGGRKNIEAVHTLDQTYALEMMGMSITSRVVQDDGKFYMSMNAQGMNLMKQVYDGEMGVIEQQGQKISVEGADLASLQEQSVLFPERNYTAEGYMAEVKGEEEINGKTCYKLLVTKPSGAKSTEFYDKVSHLKIKEIQTSSTPGDAASTTFEYSDYKVVDGINIPHSVTVSGPMPVPIVMKITSVKINSTVDPSLFKI
jgi:hypothetical protein